MPATRATPPSEALCSSHYPIRLHPRLTEATPLGERNPGHEHVWRCDYCEAAAPRAEGLTVEAVKRAIRYVTDAEPYDLSLVKECARLANDVAARLSRPSDERVPEEQR